MVKQKPRPRNDRIGVQNENHDDIAQYFQKLKPPPPPENDNTWELQYCRWWGWNWVKKQESRSRPVQHEDHKKNQKQQSRAENKKNDHQEHKHEYLSDMRHNHEKKVEKKHFKQLCNCLCFKKSKSMDSSLQELYKTPSNSVVVHERYTCGYTERHGDSISRLEVRRNISRAGKRGMCKCNIVSQDTVEEEISSSYQEDDTPEQYRSTEESSEYINVKCCCTGEKVAESPSDNNNFQNQKVIESSPKKIDFQTQTSHKSIEKVVEQNVEQKLGCLCKVCQKAAKSKKKNKHLHIVCHCCCCKCNNLHGTGKDHQENPRKSYQENTKLPQNQNCPTKGRCAETYHVENFHNMPYGTKGTLLTDNLNFLETMRPWDKIFYGTKAFSKFGTPSKKYSWLHGTQSDILDKCYSLKIDEEFSSPVSGKKYNLAPVKFDNFDQITTSTLPDPMEVEEDIKYLNYLEDQIKMDFKSRVMLDTICDAILFKAKNNESRDKTSLFLNGYASPLETHLRNEQFSSEYLHQNGNFSPREYSRPVQEVDSIFPESNPQTRHQRIVDQVEEIVRNLLSNDDESSSIKIQSDKKEKNRKSSEVKVHAAESDSMRNFKRVASPFLPEQPKRLKCELSSTDSLVETVDNLIAKIDEITVKGKVNVEKIQSVFNPDSLNDNNERENNENENVNENHADCSRRTNPSEIFHKIDQIIKCSKDNNDKIENVMQNTCPKMDGSFCEYFDREQNEVNNEAGISVSQELVNSTFEDEQYNNLDKDGTDTNLVSIKKKKFLRSMIPVRGKNL